MTAPPAAPPKGSRAPKAYNPGDSHEPVILRVRMKRRLLNRIKAIALHDQSTLQESWNLSDACREALLEWAERREAEIQRVKAARFSGRPPEETPLPHAEDAEDAEDANEAEELRLSAKN